MYAFYEVEKRSWEAAHIRSPRRRGHVRVQRLVLSFMNNKHGKITALFMKNHACIISCMLRTV
jgi:hypothetical protein